jgi:MraZ protein
MGEYRHTIDAKGRLIVPSRFREELGDCFVITRGLDNCLFVYPQREWVLIERKLKALPFTKADARAFMRFFFSGAVEVEQDRQGRVLIPSNLRDYAGIKRDVVVIGVSNRVEVWSQENWEEYTDESRLSFEQVAEKMVDFDL